MTRWHRPLSAEKVVQMLSSPSPRKHSWFCLIAGLACGLTSVPSARAEDRVAPLPPGVKAVWSFDKAEREVTPTRERVSINGLWRWQPASSGAAEPPSDGWGHFEVPGPWPGITDY